MSEETPEIPDLRARVRPPGGSEPAKSSPGAPEGSPLSKKAAFVSSPAQPGVRPSFSQRLRNFTATPAGMAAAFVLMMAMGFFLGLGLLGVTALEFHPPKSGAPKGLAGLKSSFRVRRGFRNRVRYLSARGGNLLNFIRGKSAAGPAADAADAADTAQEASEFDPGDVDVNVNYDPPAGDASSGGAVGGGSPGGRSASALGGDSPRADSRDFPFPGEKAKIKSGGGKRFLRDASATVDRFQVGGRRVGRGASTQKVTAGTTGKSKSPRSSLDFVLGDAGPAKTTAPSAAEPAAESSSGGAPAGGGGGGDTDTDTDSESLQDQMLRLGREAAKHSANADKELKRAHGLAATGNHPAAHYHYEKSEEEKAKADAAKDEMNAIAASLASDITGE